MGVSVGAGLSRTRLQRLHTAMSSYVERGEVAGVAMLVSRHGQIWTDAVGSQDLSRGDPMRRETIFRVASMSKPVTAVAAMILVEEGRLGLDEPLDALLPELANRRVLRRIDGPLEDTDPARRALTLRDLLTFRMGFGVILGPSDRYPIQQAIDRAEYLGAQAPAAARTR